MKILGIIPARYASARFPGKPLVDIGGKTMIERVYRQAEACSALTEITVATDDQRIYEHVKAFGGNVLMTSAEHTSGTERCAEVLEKHGSSWDAIINIQGDEPFIQPEQICLLAGCFDETGAQIATLAKKITEVSELENPNVVKLILSVSGRAIYFSRYPLPYNRNGNSPEMKLLQHDYYKHVGIYGYTPDALNAISKLKPASLEISESLEQLRWLQNDIHIFVRLTDFDSFGIDTPEDLNKYEGRFIR